MPSSNMSTRFASCGASLEWITKPSGVAPCVAAMRRSVASSTAVCTVSGAGAVGTGAVLGAGSVL
ncbi:unannotated protein [freshwater metagenome]|uniref:Unannotated protein n=1 Tax=freshwater metagenome TaxID=449393 RepID=A0A6J7KXE4_9ZZZZ